MNRLMKFMSNMTVSIAIGLALYVKAIEVYTDSSAANIIGLVGLFIFAIIFLIAIRSESRG